MTALVASHGLPMIGDLAVSLLVKPAAGLWHCRQGTIRFDIAAWIAVGSVPGAIGGLLLAHRMGSDSGHLTEVAVGGTLLCSAIATAWRPMVTRRRARAAGDVGSGSPSPAVRPAATVVLGIAGGFLVALTSVGSGALLMAGLTLLYPTLAPADLVGTDLVQAVPMVAAGACAHLAAGDVNLAVSAALLVGALPGAFLGTRITARRRPRSLRPVIVTLLAVTGLLLVA